MASTVPVAGSAYTYAYATLGELVAWIIGWDLILEYALGSTTVAIGWSGYVVSFLKDFGIVVPPEFAAVAARLRRHRSTSGSSTGAIINVPAMLVIAMITALLVVGVRESARVNNVIVVIKLIIIFLFIAAAGRYVSYRALGDGGQSAGRLHPAESRARRIRLERRAARRRRRILRLYRLRRGIDRGAGSQQSEARHADRHSRLARHLHRCSMSRSASC